MAFDLGAMGACLALGWQPGVMASGFVAVVGAILLLKK